MDVDQCGTVNVTDLAYLIEYLFHGGPEPCGGKMECLLPTSDNSVDLMCPIEIDSPTGDSIPIEVHMTNDITLRTVSVGFVYNSNDVDITSVSFAGSLFELADIHFADVRPGTNEVLIGAGYLLSQLTPQTGGLLATLYAQVPVDALDQTIYIDSAFVGPGGEFIYSPTGGGSVTPAYNHCESGDVIIGTGFTRVPGDVDCSTGVDIDDVVYLIEYIFTGGAPPCDPDDDGVPDC
jgi:hypothetical protein